MNILGVMRRPDFSPCSESKDTAIFMAVVESLRRDGHNVKICAESQFQHIADGDIPSVVFHMTRSPEVLNRLARLKEERGILVINDPYAVSVCNRENQLKRFTELHIPQPEYALISTCSDTALCDDTSLPVFPLWVKRADSHSVDKGDVVYVETSSEFSACLESFVARGVARVALSCHSHGDLVKFYGVHGSSFFHWFYPMEEGHSKFGWESFNDPLQHYPFDEEKLHSICDAAARALGIDVYGGDCIIDSDGNILIIDFNDWPSFSPCRDEAVGHIANIITMQNQKQPWLKLVPKSLHEQYLSTLKHADTEETFDLWFYRPLGFRTALMANRLGISPNAISVLSIFLGVAAGVMFYFPAWWMAAIGILLLVMADICDSADGQLARMTHRFSRLGRILDGACGDLWFISIYVAICLRLTPEWGWYIWILAASAGLCHALQAAMADYYRNFHLFFVKGRSGSELDDAAHVIADYRAISFRQEPLYKVFMFFYKNYTTEQEFLSPSMQRFRRLLRSRYSDQSIPQDLSADFRKASLPLMKWTNILSFNTRAFLLSISLLIGMPWLYFVAELTLFNILFIHMLLSHESICRRFTRTLDEN